jgi:hypothetical protein
MNILSFRFKVIFYVVCVVFVKCVVWTELRCLFSGFVLEIWQLGYYFAQFLMLILLSKKQRPVVICLELNCIDNFVQCLWREGDALLRRWYCVNLFWKSRTSETFLMHLLRRHIMAWNCSNCCENIFIAEFYNLSYVRNGQSKVFYGSIYLNCCEYVCDAGFYNLFYGRDGQIKTTWLGSLQRNYTCQELKLM